MKRPLIIAAMLVSLFLSLTAYSAEPDYDLLLSGGHVIDPANDIDGIMDVAVRDGKIARVAPSIPSSQAAKTVDVSGLYVVPGIIDIHVHVSPGNSLSLIPDHHFFTSGVTTCVDAGTCGADDFEEFKALIDKSKVRVLAYLNIARSGMDEGEHDPSKFNTRLAAGIAKKYPDTIVGFKSAHYWRKWLGTHGISMPYDDVHTPWTSVDSTVAAGNLASLHVMIDFNPFPPQGDYEARSYRGLILDRLRPGDIHTHCYARHFPVIGKDGKVKPDIIEARKRGIIFDVGHGGASIVFRNALPAIEQGYIADTISTDLHSGSVTGAAVSMINVMSKFLNMGLPLEDVIRRSTSIPAKVIGHPELGTLSAGSVADIAVLRVHEGEYTYLDSSGGKIRGDKKLENLVTVFGGRIVFDPQGVSYPYWKEIPKDDLYWVNPSGQEW